MTKYVSNSIILLGKQERRKRAMNFEKDKNNDYICYLDGSSFSRYKIKFLPRRLQKYAREFNLEMFSYFITNFELEGYTKTIYFDSIGFRYEITFTKNEVVE